MRCPSFPRPLIGSRRSHTLAIADPPVERSRYSDRLEAARSQGRSIVLSRIPKSPRDQVSICNRVCGYFGWAPDANSDGSAIPLLVKVSPSWNLNSASALTMMANSPRGGSGVAQWPTSGLPRSPRAVSPGAMAEIFSDRSSRAVKGIWRTCSWPAELPARLGNNARSV